MISTILIALVSIGLLLKLKRFFRPVNHCRSKRKLDGKTIIVTGGSSGIGFATALDLASRGARVIVASERYEDCLKSVADITEKTSNKNVVAKLLDLADLGSIRRFADDILTNEKRLDVLINNAGTLRNMKKITNDGLPEVLQVNYFGHFLLTHLLIDLLKKSSPSKVVNLSSAVHQYGVLDFEDIRNLPSFLPNFWYYCNSKLLVLYGTWVFAEKLKKYNISVNCVHPGLVRSNIFLSSTDFWSNLAAVVLYYYLYPCVLDATGGCQTTIHSAICEKSDNITGMYFKNCEATLSPVKKDLVKIKKVWGQSIELVGFVTEEIKI